MENYQQSNSVPPKTWLAESILVTLFCCLPFGIVGIINASKVETRFRSGDINGALHASKEAGNWVKWGFLSSVIIWVLYFLFILLIGIGSAL